MRSCLHRLALVLKQRGQAQEALQNPAGVEVPKIAPGSLSSYFHYMFFAHSSAADCEVQLRMHHGFSHHIDELANVGDSVYV